MAQSDRALKIVQEFYPNVTTVKDAKASLDIEVTKKDVSASKVKSHKDCAMATACKRMADVDGVIMSRAIAYLVKDDTAVRYKVPTHLAREIVAFDRGGAFEPGEYRLNPPDTHIKLGSKRRGSGAGKRSGKNKIRHVTTNVRTGLIGV